MILTWGISALTVLGVVTRPFRWPEVLIVSLLMLR